MSKQRYNDYETSKDDVFIEGCRLIQTSIACPEQYEVFDNTTGAQIGYLRLRHGYFRADYPDCGGETVYTTNTSGDGCFDSDERQEELTRAVKALLEHKAKEAAQ